MYEKRFELGARLEDNGVNYASLPNDEKMRKSIANTYCDKVRDQIRDRPRRPTADGIFEIFDESASYALP